MARIGSPRDLFSVDVGISFLEVAQSQYCKANGREGICRATSSDLSLCITAGLLILSDLFFEELGEIGRRYGEGES